jgi:hypothetical protein
MRVVVVLAELSDSVGEGTAEVRHVEHRATLSAPRATKSLRTTSENPKRMKGLEPSTFCMASRCSSQLSYIREVLPL